jgi:hypothetical protein
VLLARLQVCDEHVDRILAARQADVEHPLGRQCILLGGMGVNVSCGANDGQPAGERQFVTDQWQPGPSLDVRPLDELEHPPRAQAQGLAAGAARRLEAVEDLAPPLVVDGFLQGDDVEARQALRDRLGTFSDVRLVARPFAHIWPSKGRSGVTNWTL